MAKKQEYKSVAIPTSIAITSRCSIKVTDRIGNDQFYTLEYHEERQIPDVPGVDIQKERALLWDTCNAEVDHQIEDIIKLYGK